MPRVSQPGHHLFRTKTLAFPRGRQPEAAPVPPLPASPPALRPCGVSPARGPAPAASMWGLLPTGCCALGAGLWLRAGTQSLAAPSRPCLNKYEYVWAIFVSSNSQTYCE